MPVADENRSAVEEEYRALRESCGIALETPIDGLALSGEDRERFLNGQLTCDVRGLGPGEGTYGFFTDIKGRILSDVVLRALDDRFLLELPAGHGEAIREHLLDYVIVDRVEAGTVTALGRLRFEGPGSRRCLAESLALPVPEGPWGHEQALLEGREARVGGMGGKPKASSVEGWSVTLAAETAEELFEGWSTGEPPAGARAVGPLAFESLRIEAGRLRYGVDYDRDHFPQESGRDDAVDYDKGCYLGQEVVARIHYRGGVNRLPRGLLFSGSETPLLGSSLLLEGREVGRVTSATWSFGLGRPAGLAVVHRRGAEPGTRLSIEGGGEAEVAELPLLV